MCQKVSSWNGTTNYNYILSATPIWTSNKLCYETFWWISIGWHFEYFIGYVKKRAHDAKFRTFDRIPFDELYCARSSDWKRGNYVLHEKWSSTKCQLKSKLDFKPQHFPTQHRKSSTVARIAKHITEIKFKYRDHNHFIICCQFHKPVKYPVHLLYIKILWHKLHGWLSAVQHINLY